MSDITQAFVKQWDDTIRLQAQQKESRLASTVFDKGNITGESFTANRFAALEDTPEKTTRHGDTVWSAPNHSTRVAIMRDFYQALPIDRADEPKVLANPNGAYMQSLINAWNRKQDNLIFQALIGNSRTKEDALVALPAAQIILNGAAAFTKAKILTAKKQFRKNEADEQNGEELFMVYNADMMEDVLTDTTLTSADYMAVKMLQEGDVSGKWLGFTWVPYENIDLGVIGANIASTVAYAKSALHRGTGFVEGKSQRRGDKQDAMQVSMAASFGAVRVEEEKVVRIDFQY